MRVLLAEDDTILADGLCRSLRQAGYAVDWVSSGNQADAALIAQPYDLLILDLGLPQLPGLDVLKQLRARSNTMPVLILTAADSIEQRVKVLAVAGRRAGGPRGAQALEGGRFLSIGWGTWLVGTL